MLKKLTETGNYSSAAIARLTLGLVILPHGAQKALGLFGGGGIGGTIDFFAATWQVPALLTVLVIVIEFLGSLALIVGFLGRVAAAGIAAVMIGAVYLQHLSNGFFMNWSGAQPGEGYEYHLLALGLAAIVMLRGSGAFSLDRSLVGASGGRAGR